MHSWSKRAESFTRVFFFCRAVWFWAYDLWSKYTNPGILLTKVTNDHPFFLVAPVSGRLFGNEN